MAMLKKSTRFPAIEGPVVTVVMDGVGVSSGHEGNAVADAYTPVLDQLLSHRPNTRLAAHGPAVGMPSKDDMGNSEVGHNAIGAGQIYSQGAALVSEAIASGSLFSGEAWQAVVSNVAGSDRSLHLLGLFSDGNVHSHINHLKALIVDAKSAGVRRVRVHVLLDGRDVPETSALEYLEPFEGFLGEVRGEQFDARIASGGGRMFLTMDRYEADWSMVERGWQTHVLGEGRRFASAIEAVETLRAETPGVIDQNLGAFVIADDKGPVGPVLDGDSVVFFNFRGDRAIEISRAFEDEVFDAFDRQRHPDVVFAGMLQYDGDLQIPQRFLVAPPAIRDTMGEYLASDGISQLAISETQKFGHVTYFWNGNRSSRFDESIESWVEIPSDRVSFDERPWMKAAEITDRLIDELKTGRYRTARVNYANGDMVGHTGQYHAARVAVETVDLMLARLLPVIDALGGAALITADHGNAEEMYQLDKQGEPMLSAGGKPRAKTSHTLNPVPFILYENVSGGLMSLRQDGELGLANIAATTVNLLGYEAPSVWAPGLLSEK